MEEALYLKFPPQNNFYTPADYGSKFLPEPFFPLKMFGSHWLTSASSPHLGGPPNGLKCLTKGNQLEQIPFISKIM